MAMSKEAGPPVVHHCSWSSHTSGPGIESDSMVIDMEACLHGLAIVGQAKQAVARETSGVGKLLQLKLRLRHILYIGIHKGSVLGFFAPMVIESLPSDARVKAVIRGSKMRAALAILQQMQQSIVGNKLAMNAPFIHLA